MRKHFLLLLLMTLLPLAGWATDLTVGLTTLSKTWGDADPVHPTTAQFTFNGTSAQKAALLDYLTFTRVDAGTDVGAYAYTWTLDPAYKSSGYFVSDDVFIGTPNGVLNITAKDISAAAFTVTLDAVSYTYTGTAVEPTITSLKIGELDIASADYDVTFTNNAGAGTGNMTITGKNNLTGSQADVQAFTIVGGLSLVGKTVTYAGDALTYTGEAQTPTEFAIDGLTYGTHFAVKAGSYANNTNAGTASVTLVGVGDYETSPEITAEFGIAQAAATITPEAKNKNFGAAEPTFTAIVTGAVNGEELVYEVNRKNFGDIAHEQPGTYTNALYVEVDAVADVNKNYTITTGEANFTIGKKSMVASGMSYTNINDQVYDVTKATSDDGITTTYTLKNKYAALEGNQYYTLEEGTDFTVSYENNRAVGEATVKFKGAGSRFNSGTEKSQTFNITAKPVAVTAKVEPVAVGFGAEYTPSVTWGAGATEADIDALGAITYSYKENNGGTEGADVANPAAVGKYFVYANFTTPNTNYAVTNTKGEFEITNGDIQAKVSVANVTYGTAPTFDIVPFEDGTSFPTGSAVTAGATYVVKNASKETMTCDLNKLPVGTYTVTNTATATNYNVVVAAGTFTVSARALTDASIAVAALDAKTYVGDKVENPSTTNKITFTYPGTTESYTLLEGTDYDVSNEGFDNINAGTTAGSIKLIAKDGGKFTGDKTVNFEISKANLTITANDATWEYGTPENPATRYSATYTLLGKDAGKDLTEDQSEIGFNGLLKVKRVVGETVGTYTNGLEVSFETADGTPVTGDAIADNYTIVPATGKLTIAPSTITLVVDDKVGVYGDDVTGFTSTLSLSTEEGDNESLTDLQKEQWATFVNTTGVSYTLATADDNKYVVSKEYEITATGATSTNYDVKINPGKYTVTARPITITANAQTIAQGESLDQDDWYITGTKGYADDDLGVTLSTTMTAVGGPYTGAITVAATNTNYEFNCVPGDLTITGAGALALGEGGNDLQLISDYAGQTVNVTINFAGTRNGRNLGGVRNWNEYDWVTLTLPFDITVAKLSEKLSYAIVNEIDNSQTKVDGGSSEFYGKLTMKGAYGKDYLPANKPILVKIANNIADVTGGKINFGPQLIVAPEDLTVDAGKGAKFIGTYSEMEVDKDDNENIWFRIGGGYAKWAYILSTSSASWTIAPFEAYIDMSGCTSAPAGAARSMTFYFEEIDGSKTAIKSISADDINGKQNVEGMYNLNGMKLNSVPTQKGVYIQNGKKVVIK